MLEKGLFNNPTGVIGLIVILFLILTVVMLFFRFVPIGLWITAYFSDVKIGVGTLVGMRLRRVAPQYIVRPMIKATKAGLKIDINELEAHYLAGGNVNVVIDALIAAQRANIDLEFEQAAAIDLAGRNVFEAVQVSVNPKVIETPVIAGVAMDGIEVQAKAKVTVRANIERLVGGAGEETIIARVGEGIVTTVGSAAHHKLVLENPDSISQTILRKGLDAGTAYEILSGFSRTTVCDSEEPIVETIPSPTRAITVSSPAPPTSRSMFARTVILAFAFTSIPLIATPAIYGVSITLGLTLI